MTEAFLRFAGVLGRPETVFLSDKNERMGVIPYGKLVVGRRLAQHERHVLDKRDGQVQHSLRPLFVALDEINNRAMARVSSQKHDMCVVRKLDVVLPEIRQDLGGFVVAELHVIAGFMLLRVGIEPGDVVREIDVDNGEILLHGPLDVSLDNISQPGVVELYLARSRIGRGEELRRVV